MGVGAGLAVVRFGLEVQRLKRQVPAHREYWDQRNADGEFGYVSLGDSSAQGVGVDDPADGYVSILAERLATQQNRPVAVRNLSVSGATLATLIDDQLPQLAELPTPAVCTLCIGGNDMIQRRFDPNRFRDEFAQILAALPPGAFVGDLPTFGHWPFEPRVRAVNPIIHELVADHGHHLVPLHEVSRAQWLVRILGQVNGDWFHPNQAGYRLWADAFWDAMESNRPA